MKELKAMAALAAEKARSLGSHSFSSLSPRERRWVHLIIAREPDLHSESEGTGTFKTLKVFRK
jgi:predicted RNA-binding protein Jag